jgi:hypothetical protein
MTINGIRFAERNGLSAYVDWNARCLYYDRTVGANAWDYYFRDNTFDFSGQALRVKLATPYRPGAEEFAAYSGLSVTTSVHHALDRFCTPHPLILDQVDKFIAAHFSPKHTLGVHVRLTDAAKGFEGRKAVESTQFRNAVEAWLRQRSNHARVFLATDDELLVKHFHHWFGDYVIFQSCLRSRDGTSIHGHYDGGVEGSGYRKGFEAMIDALLLSRCDHLICSASRLTWYVLCVNPHLRYTDLSRIVLGIDGTPWGQVEGI